MTDGGGRRAARTRGGRGDRRSSAGGRAVGRRFLDQAAGALIALALGGGAAPAQEPPGGGGDAPDSVSLREAARDAQHAFERTRVRLAPWAAPFGPPRGSCDEVVGRFCFWHESPDDPWRPPPEPSALTAARDSLLATLETAAGRLPGDGWIAGQRVRYLAEAERHAEAAAAAATCRAESWWCAALAGYARHAAGDAAGAEAAFDAALAVMPVAGRAAWEDLEMVLPADARSLWRRSRPAERIELADRAWWLADPLWSTPGNERRAEHFARHVLDRLQTGARSGYDVRWGDDLRELLLRYGWPAGFERSRERWPVGTPGRDAVVARDLPGARGFLPPRAVLESPKRVGAGEWRVDARQPRAGYSPAYADRFLELEPQVAVFRRGDSVGVAAGWALPPDSLDGAAETEAAIAVRPGPAERGALARRVGRGPSGWLLVWAPAEPAVVSIEVLARAARLAARSRHGLRLPDPALSDLLLLAPGSALPATLEEAAERARGSTDIDPGERVGIYWEARPPAGVREIRWALALRDERGGFWRALGAALRLGERAGGEVALEWAEAVPEGSPVARSVELRLPADLPAGDYALVLTGEFAGRAPLSVERRIRIVR